MTETEITVYDELDAYGKPVGVGQVFKNELAGMKKERKQKVDFKGMFEKICESADSSTPFETAAVEQISMSEVT